MMHTPRLSGNLGHTKSIEQDTRGMEKGNLIKAGDASDKRKVHLHLTAEGESILQQARPMELFSQATLILDQNETEIEGEVFVQALAHCKKPTNHSFLVFAKPVDILLRHLEAICAG